MLGLRYIAMGLVLMVVDVGKDVDLVPDLLGWILVLVGLGGLRKRVPAFYGLMALAFGSLVVSLLTLGGDSVDQIDPVIGYAFSLPTLVFLFLLCDSVMDMVSDYREWFSWLRAGLILAAVLPVTGYLRDSDGLAYAGGIIALVTNLVIIVLLWIAGDDDDNGPPGSTDRQAEQRTRAKAKPRGTTGTSTSTSSKTAPRRAEATSEDRPPTGEEIIERVRRRREKRQRSSGSD